MQAGGFCHYIIIFKQLDTAIYTLYDLLNCIIKQQSSLTFINQDTKSRQQTQLYFLKPKKLSF